jgi:hypothetical protein
MFWLNKAAEKMIVKGFADKLQDQDCSLNMCGVVEVGKELSLYCFHIFIFYFYFRNEEEDRKHVIQS